MDEVIRTWPMRKIDSFARTLGVTPPAEKLSTQMDCRREREDLQLSVMEVGHRHPMHNKPTSTSENGAMYGAEDGAVSGAGDGAVSGAENGAMSGAEDGAVSGVEDGAVSGVEDGAVSGVEDGAVSGAEDGGMSGVEDGAMSGVEDGAVYGAVVSTGNGSSKSNSREIRRSTHTAIMEEDNYQNLQTNCNGNDILSNLALDNSFFERFDDISNISQGSFGRVMKGRNKMDDRYYAIKIVPQRTNAKERFEREVKALAHLQHTNIVRYFTAWWEERVVSVLDGSEESCRPISSKWEGDSSSSRRGRRSETCLLIQMELCEMSLEDWTWKRNEDFTKNVNKDQSLQIFRQIIDGINYIHSNMFIHRDLKPANIFLMKDMSVKIGDFGLVTRVTEKGESQLVKRTPEIGTPSYMAPEQSENNYGREVDIFPLGLILFELLWRFGTKMGRDKMWDHIRVGKLPNGFANDYRGEAHEIKKMLSRDPKRRPSAEDLKEVLFFDQPVEYLNLR
ncbi:interferon-induced, double-stranded RNA-activated protein kinase-like [Mantella aurantiaca]